MNVIIANQQEDLLASLDIEVIKTLRGSYDPEEIIGIFSNFFFARMIIDVTALKQYEDIVTYQKLSIGLAIDKLILVIPANSSVANNYFISRLISMGYYNFTSNKDGVKYLLEKPNTYKDVAHLHQIEQTAVVAPPVAVSGTGGPKIIGVKNLTDHAGATTLVYMMKKDLVEKYNLSVLAVEVNKRDFAFFKDQTMISVDRNTVAAELLRAKNYNVIFVDLNDYDESLCEEVIYLIETSILKLNKLVLRDRGVFARIKDKKVIINKCVLPEKDLMDFQYEAGINIFYTLPPLNDRQTSDYITKMLAKLGIIRLNDTTQQVVQKGGLFHGIFK